MADKESYFPVEWADDDRMNFMFSAFPESRNVNPKHWDSKLEFWSNLIFKSCKYCDELVLDMDTLRRRFARNCLVPLGLETVLREMLKEGRIQYMGEFRSDVNQGWMSWSYGVAKKSLWSSVGGVLGLKESVDGPLVVHDRVKEKAEQILTVHYKNVQHETTDYIVPWNVVKARCHIASHVIDDDMLELVMCYLQKHHQAAVVITREGEKAVKFAHKRQENVEYLVSDADLEILSLKKAIACLTLKVKRLSDGVERLKHKAETFAHQHLRSAAMKVIKAKAQQQRLLDRTMTSLTTLEELLHRIHNAETDKMIVDALKSGHTALKLAQEGMSAESVDKIMVDVEEILEESEDIKSALAQGNERILESDGLEGDNMMEALERELGELALADNGDEIVRKNPSSQYMGAIPSPPTESPSKMALDQLPEVPSQSPQKHRGDERTAVTQRALLG